ncbi:MAG: DUF2726 domain-containing protein [Mariprofundus sp.]|nr:DUF2726 domain-containing protein [Mariprofundus sp.]
MDILTAIIIVIVVMVMIGLIKSQKGIEFPKDDREREWKEKVKPSEKPSNAPLPYLKKNNFFTAGERVFYHVLNSAVGNQHVVFGQVRIADLLDIKKGISKSDWQRSFNHIKAKHVDFVLCRADDLKVVLIVP